MSARRQLENVDQIRYLLLHEGSEDLFVMNSHRQAKQAMDEGCVDVTGNEFYEHCFIHKLNPYEEQAKKDKVVEDPDLPLHLKYRPAKLDEVVGQEEVARSLAKALESKTRPHTFLFTGPSGCGKTTLARIVASMIGCEAENITEADAASNTGIEATKDLLSNIRYKGFGDSPNKMYIIDEIHMLSKQAFASLLKTIEEPPPHVYFALCTTEDSKIPEAIRTRCLAYSLKSVKFDPLMDLLEMVVAAERMKPFDGLLEMIARACNGSPRQALVMLAMTISCEDEKEAARLLEQPLDNKDIIYLCRMMMNGGLTWEKVTSTLKAMSETNPESIRIVIVNYLNSCLMGSKSEKQTTMLLDMQREFLVPCNTSDKFAPILQAFGNIIYPPN
jgi:DNA polymerase III gamma/tau subunit